MRQMKPLNKANMVLSFNKSIFNYYFIERRYILMIKMSKMMLSNTVGFSLFSAFKFVL